MKKRKSIILILCLACILAFLSACGKEKEVSAEDYYGVWEYVSSNDWICIYDDGTYEWYTSEGLNENGTYHMDGDVLSLDEKGLSYSFDDDGNLSDSTDRFLFATELPDFSALGLGGSSDPVLDNEGLGGDPGDFGEIDFATLEDFVGTWEDADDYIWLVIYDDSSWARFYEDGSYDAGECYVTEGEIYFDTFNDRYFINADGYLEEYSGRLMYPSELPDYVLQGASDPGDGGYVPSAGSDPGDGGQIYYATADDFEGTWESTTENVWLVIYSDGVWTKFYEGGGVESGYYYVDMGELYFDTINDRYFINDSGYLEEYNGGLMFRSEVPQSVLQGAGSDPGDGGYVPGSDPGDGGYVPGSDPGDGGYVPGSTGVSIEDFYGTWTREDGGIWYTIYDNGTFKVTYFDGDFYHGEYWLEGDNLILGDYSNYLYYFGSGVMDGDGYICYATSEPDF